MKKIKTFFKLLIQFIKDVANDPKIPSRDKKVLLILLALIISPVDFIPDWIPIIGLLDDLVVVALILDYFFITLDQQILLAHYPWGMKSFTKIRLAAKVLTALTPRFIKTKLWTYKPPLY